MLFRPIAAALALSFALPTSADPAIADPALEKALPEIRAGFAQWKDAQNVPGLVWGIVKDGKLLHVESLGVQDLEQRRPVTPDSAFRIASMSKAFTAYGILKLAESGNLRLDDAAATHVPELAGWAQGISVGNLMHHTAGFVTDDPWGDRQQSLPEADFTAMLKAGVPFHRAPGTAYEYSNFGYATLGRMISNLSGRPYQRQIAVTIWAPLGMTSTTFEVRDIPDERLARGYRWENGAHLPEPVMRDGAFGAMGGVVTTASDYWRWMAHLLSGWPAPASTGDTAGATTIRAMREGGGFVHARARPGKDSADCRLQMLYAGGLVAGQDCLLGAVLFHSGGYPGYGSHMLLLPDAGVGLFAFSNRTYAAPLSPVWDAAGALQRAGLVQPRPVPLSDSLSSGYAAAVTIWAEGRIDAQPDMLAMNMLMDRSATNWKTEISRLKTAMGKCDTTSPIQPDGALSGRFRWTCANGVLSGQLLLAPTHTPQIQALRMAAE